MVLASSAITYLISFYGFWLYHTYPLHSSTTAPPLFFTLPAFPPHTALHTGSTPVATVLVWWRTRRVALRYLPFKRHGRTCSATCWRLHGFFLYGRLFCCLDATLPPAACRSCTTTRYLLSFITATLPGYLCLPLVSCRLNRLHAVLPVPTYCAVTLGSCTDERRFCSAILVHGCAGATSSATTNDAANTYLGGSTPVLISDDLAHRLPLPCRRLMFARAPPAAAPVALLFDAIRFGWALAVFRWFLLGALRQHVTSTPGPYCML